MAIQIIKKGIADTIQDIGRYGYQHLGIQANGYLDYQSARLANYILNNPINAPVFEIHFPASSFSFTQAHTICISGANFVPLLNEKSIALYTPIEVKENDVLQFLKPLQGRVAYVAIQGKIKEEAWLNSHSYFANSIQKDAQFEWEASEQPLKNSSNQLQVFKGGTTTIQEIQSHVFSTAPLQFITGPAWNDLTQEAQKVFLSTEYHISRQANRMGYPLKGALLQLNKPNQYLSAAVTRGTLQLLPNGELMVLMADHQTIGGYANLGQIILVDLPRLAQVSNQTSIHFRETTIDTAHKLYQQIEKKFIHRS
ncbi:MAG: biotin-dependent carboxyltransferase family protein [Sediminibacterium sp.]|nr:MAG: biotin-dependent carboxyltransferase family protein [Sediminibacterium sp.]